MDQRSRRRQRERLRKPSAEYREFRARKNAIQRAYVAAHGDRIKRRQREWLRKRRAEDPEFRARKNAIQRAYVAAHREGINSHRRLRYATEPEFRAKLIAASANGVRGRQLKKKYGISLEEYEILLARQHGVCAICEQKSSQTLCVDHCHVTGRVRGLLCRTCNMGLGYYSDNPAFMRNAAAYLERSRRVGRRARVPPSS